MTPPAITKSQTIEFRTDRVERLMIGVLLILVGGGALAFWNVERDLVWPQLAILAAGAAFALLGLYLIGYRCRVRLDRQDGVSELRTLYGLLVSSRHYSLAEFEAVGCHGATSEILTLDVVLFRRDGGYQTLRTMLSDAEARAEIARIAACLGLPAEYTPRTRLYRIGH